MEDMNKEFKRWKDLREKAIRKLNELADGLDKVHRNTNISKISGNSIGIIGGTAAVIGLLSAPYTLGLSLGLAIGGACAGVAGATTTLGSSLTEDIISKRLCKEAEKLVRDDLNECENLKKIFSNKELRRNVLSKGGKIAGNTLQKTAHVANVIVRAEQTSEIINAAKILLNPSNTVHILGVSASIIFIVLDLIELIETSIDLNDGSKSKYSEKIREMIKNLEINKNEIEQEINNENDELDDSSNLI
jgi:hypothetical protein